MYTFQARAIVNGKGWEHVFQATDYVAAMEYVDGLLGEADYSCVEICTL